MVYMTSYAHMISYIQRYKDLIGYQLSRCIGLILTWPNGRPGLSFGIICLIQVTVTDDSDYPAASLSPDWHSDTGTDDHDPATRSRRDDNVHRDYHSLGLQVNITVIVLHVNLDRDSEFNSKVISSANFEFPRQIMMAYIPRGRSAIKT